MNEKTVDQIVDEFFDTKPEVQTRVCKDCGAEFTITEGRNYKLCPECRRHILAGNAQKARKKKTEEKPEAAKQDEEYIPDLSAAIDYEAELLRVGKEVSCLSSVLNIPNKTLMDIVYSFAEGFSEMERIIRQEERKDEA